MTFRSSNLFFYWASTCQASNVNQSPLKAVKMLNFHAFLGPTQVSCLAERSWESGATFFNYINSVETNGITGKIRFEVRKNSIILWVQINYFQSIYFSLKLTDFRGKEMLWNFFITPLRLMGSLEKYAYKIEIKIRRDSRLIASRKRQVSRREKIE